MVVEFTAVVVPFTIKSPLIVVVDAASKPLTDIASFKDAVYEFKLPVEVSIFSNRVRVEPLNPFKLPVEV